MMPLPFTNRQRQSFTVVFLLLFYTLAVYKWLNGQWLYQFDPQFFNTRFDGISWLFMQTGLHQWLLNNTAGCIWIDIFFYSAPLAWFLCQKKWPRLILPMAFIWLAVNWLYVQCFTLYPTNSIEGHVCWLLFPVLFATRRLKSFYFVLHGLRYFFFFFFASAAIWKLRQGGVFNVEQMSGVLLYQHKEFLVASPTHWYTQFIYWLIHHPFIGYLLYLTGTLLELIFLVGFFTKKYDRWLFAGFVSFLLMDMLIMRIPYFEMLPLASTLLFSRYAEPEKNG